MESSSTFKGLLLDVLGLKPEIPQQQADAGCDAAAPDAANQDLEPSATQHSRAKDDSGIESTYAARLASINEQFEVDAATAKDAQDYLQLARQQAQQREVEALAAADAEFTPGWRQAGLPSKSSLLQLDQPWLSGRQLLDLGEILAKQQAWQQKEVLHPPAVFAYCNKAADPHFWQTTGNQRVRQSISAARIAARTTKQHQQQQAQQQARHKHLQQQAPKQAQQLQTNVLQQHQQADSTFARSSGSKVGNGASSGSSRGIAKAKTQPTPVVGSKRIPWSQLSPEEAAAKMAAAAAAREKAVACMVTPEQKELEERIIKRMYQRLSFLRNPRFPVPPRVAAMMQYGLKGIGVAHRSSKTAGANRRKALSSNSCACKVPADVGFKLVPAGALFDVYEPGGVYFQTVQLQNTGTVIRELRLLPPSSCYFQVSLPRFPLAASTLAPGMSAEVTVCFMPDSLGDYEDVFVVQTPLGNFEVHLTGRRPHPNLTLPAVLQVGEVLVGNHRVRSFEFTNTGGDGCFLLLSAEQWQAELQQRQQAGAQQQPAALMQQQHTQLVVAAGGLGQEPVMAAGMQEEQDGYPAVASSTLHSLESDQASAGAFSISPAYLDLPAGTPGRFTVQFTPGHVGTHTEEFMLVCDNCTTQLLRVEGCGSKMQVQLLQLDGRQWLPEDEQTPLWFGEVHPGCSSNRVLRAHNPTGLPLPYYWTVAEHQQVPSNGRTYHQQAGSCSPAFAVEPASGVLQPGQQVDFLLRFSPHSVSTHAGTLQLNIQKSGDAGLLSIREWGTRSCPQHALRALLTRTSTHCTHAASSSTVKSPHVGNTSGVLEAASATATTSLAQSAPQQDWPGAESWVSLVQLSVEGLGRPIALAAHPGPCLLLPGSLTVGDQLTKELLLVNDTPAPARFAIQAAGSAGAHHSACFSIHPVEGVVPACGSLPLCVSFAAVAAGVHTQDFTCRVEHGSNLLLQTKVAVKEAMVVPESATLDFGMLYLGTSATLRTLQLKNTAPHSSCHWRLQQLTKEPTVPPMVLTCDPPMGVLAPAAGCSTAVTVTASCEGSHRLLLCVISSSKSCSTCAERSSCSYSSDWTASRNAGCSCCRSYVQVLLTVSAPRVVLDQYRLHMCPAYLGAPQHHTLRMRNTSRLPFDFTWSVQQLPHHQYEQLQRLKPSTANTAEAAANVAATCSSNADAGIACQLRKGVGDGSISCRSADVGEQLDAGHLRLTITPNSARLDSGQEQQLQLLLEPVAVGAVALLCCCQVPAMKQLTGFLVTACVEGLQVRYEVLQPSELLALQELQEPQEVDAGSSMSTGRLGSSHTKGVAAQMAMEYEASSVGSTPYRNNSSPLLADFGVVSLHQPAELLLRVTNLTSIPALVRPWMGRFAAALSAAAKASTLPSSAGVVNAAGCSMGDLPANTVAAMHVVGQGASGCSQHPAGSRGRSSSPVYAASLQLLSGQRQRQQQACTSVASMLGRGGAVALAFGVGSASSLSSSKRALTGPFRTEAGNAMMVARQVAAAATAALGSGTAGCAIQFLPEVCELPGYQSIVVRLLAFNNLPGTYVDDLYVQVGQLPAVRIPVLLRVTGSPLLFSKYRVQQQGLEVLQQHLHQELQQRQQPTILVVQQQAVDADASGQQQDSQAARAAVTDAGQVCSGQRCRSPRTECSVNFGIVPAGVEVQRTFYINNTGPLPMRLAWTVQPDSAVSNHHQPGRNQSFFNSTADSSRPPSSTAGAGAAAQAGLGSTYEDGSRPSSAPLASPSAAADAADAAAAPESGANGTQSTSNSSKLGKSPGGAKAVAMSVDGRGTASRLQAGAAKPSTASAPGSTAAAARGKTPPSGGRDRATAANQQTHPQKQQSSGPRGSKALQHQQRQQQQDDQRACQEPEAQQQQGQLQVLEEDNALQTQAEGQAAAATNAAGKPVQDGAAAISNGNAASVGDGFEAFLPPGGPSSLLQMLHMQQDNTATSASAASACSAAFNGGSRHGVSDVSPCAAQPDLRPGVSVVQPQDCGAAASPAFTVSPNACVIAAGQQQKFVVSFCSQDCTKQQAVTLVGKQAFERGGSESGSGSNLSGLTLCLWPSSSGAPEQERQQVGSCAAGPLQCFFAGGFHANAAAPPSPLPGLAVRLAASAAAVQLTPSDPDCFNWVCSSIHPASHPSYCHTATLDNTSGTTQIMKLAVEGPFELVAVVPSVPQDPVAFRGWAGSNSLGHSAASVPHNATSGSHISRGSSSAPTDFILLPPRESVKVTIRFTPPAFCLEAPPPSSVALHAVSADGLHASAATVAATMQAPTNLHADSVGRAAEQSSIMNDADNQCASHTDFSKEDNRQAARAGASIDCSNSSGSDSCCQPPLPKQFQGALVVTTKSGHTQDLQLSASVLCPAVSVRPRAVDFGCAHSAAPRTCKLLLTNPTVVDAAWETELQDMHGAGAEQQLAGSSRGKEAVFSMTPICGQLPGRGLGMPNTQWLSLSFAPRSSGAHSATLKVYVHGGACTYVRLQGMGTFTEVEQQQA